MKTHESPTQITGQPSLGDANSYLVELEGLSGGIPESPATILIRESPTRASGGSTSVTSTSTEYTIDSFFDIWVEVSVDGGATWLPPTQYSPDGGQTWIAEGRPLHLVGTPEPASLAMFAVAGMALSRRHRKN